MAMAHDNKRGADLQFSVNNDNEMGHVLIAEEPPQSGCLISVEPIAEVVIYFLSVVKLLIHI